MELKCDVLVIGSGIAGISAAIEAASHGASVALACAGPLFGGSSFYPGTWGLGLIGPESDTDEADLIASILRVGCGVADERLVETFVRGIHPSIVWLEDELGVRLKRPESAESALESTFIPCFDHKHRLWRGITRKEFEAAAKRAFEELGIDVLERCELMHLTRGEDGTRAIVGAILYDRRAQELFGCIANAVVLSTGGTGGLFERSLTSQDVLSSAQGIAMDAGCSLVNIEFMQMMPGLVYPARGIVFNEKTFRYAMFEDENKLLPREPEDLGALLEMRSGHGPFTCRLDDALVDMAIDAAGDEGLSVRYRFPHEGAPEFVRTFAQWMQDELGITPADNLRVAMYAHATNGGIQIDECAQTGVPGLYACGEVTGGMHGADRIGGLSSANGLVFGRIAGTQAAKAAQRVKSGAAIRHVATRALELALQDIRMTEVPLDDMDASRIAGDMKRTMSAHAMIQRTEAGLADALQDIEQLQREARFHGACRDCVIPRDASLARGIRISSQLKLAHAMLSAMRERRESLGSHYRPDYPPHMHHPRA